MIGPFIILVFPTNCLSLLFRPVPFCLHFLSFTTASSLIALDVLTALAIQQDTAGLKEEKS